MTAGDIGLDLSRYKLGWSDEEDYVFKPKRGLDVDLVNEMSWMKSEPQWMLDYRLKSLEHFRRRPMPNWGGDMSEIYFDDIYYYIKPTETQVDAWDELPDSVKETYEKLGIPEAERKYLAGVTAQYECLRGDTLVWTTRGMFPIKELQADDEVFSLDEATKQIVVSRVVASACSGEKEIYEIRARGQVIGASGNHPFLVLRDERRPGRERARFAARWIRADELAAGDLVAVASRLPLVPVPVGASVGASLAGESLPAVGILAGVEGGVHTSEMLGFVRVESIERAGSELTYDIEVAGHHNFVAEGFVVHNSEVVYHRNREDLEQQGVIFTDMDTALREHPELVKQYFGTIIPKNDNKFAALNSAVWSGGSFVYVPEGVSVEMPLQAYFRINAENMGQFERTLIIAEAGSQVHYIEGCSAPVYTTDSLHSAVVEIAVKESARVTYTTIQNWSNNVFNLVTKRARVEAEGHMEWIDGNIGCLAQGSRVTTPSGLKPIELVVPGEKVLSYDEATGALCFRNVVAKRFSGYQPVREVRAGHRRLFVTDNHPFYSFTHDEERPKKLGRYELAYVRADQLTKAIVPATSIDFGTPYKLDLPDTEVEFTTANQHRSEIPAVRRRAPRLDIGPVTTDDLMWLFGLFTGDGSTERQPSKSGGTRWARVTFSIPTSDRARERLVSVMGELLPGATAGERGDGITLRWSSVELADLFERNGFVSGASKKRVPLWVFDLPESQRLQFVAGYLDSDGCASAGKRGFSIKSVNLPLLEDVANLLTTLGIHSRLHTEHDGEREVTILGYRSLSRGSHRIEFATDERLVSLVSEPLRRAALAQAPVALRHFRRVGRSNIELPESVEIRSVQVGEPSVTVPTWDIEVEGTGNFVSEGFIVHNSRLTMKYPAVYMVGPKASGEVLSVAYAGPGQHQDAGAKMVHAAPETTSKIVSKSISKDGGRTSYRGLVRVEDDAYGCRSHVQCDALILDEDSVSDTFPYMEVGARDAVIGHEATVSKVADEQLFYLMSRGLTQEQAMGMIVNGFIEPVTRTLPMEYAVEWSRLIELQMEGSVG